MKVVLPEGAGNAQGDSPCETGRAQERCTAPGGIRAALRKHPGTAHRGAVCILSFTAVLYVRLDFSIAEDPAAEARRKVACIAERD